MFTYALSVALADSSQSITDPSIAKLLKQAIDLTNHSKNAIRKGRYFQLSDPLDESHFKIFLQSNTEVIPTRAISSLSRSLIAVDKNNIISTYRGCVLQSAILDEKLEKENISDVELIQTLTFMVFGQSQIKSKKEKELAKKYINIIRGLVIEYLSQKML